ncbi:MAG: hypothetical protein M3255_08805 [Pseudomonadota bacterium]|nr:hypothetical protein [Pseudomonadota bacterium]
MNWWNSYWFRPAPLLDLAILRIVAVGLQLWLMLYHYNLMEFLHERASLPDNLYTPLLILKLLLSPFGWGYRPSLEVLIVLYWATVVAGVLALIGLRTNVSLLVFAVGSVTLAAFVYSFGEMHHTDAVMMIALSVLALSPSGQVLSVDAWRHRYLNSPTSQKSNLSEVLYAENTFARWPILLIQWFFVLMYISAFISKMAESGTEWMNGYTLQYYLILDGMRWDSPLALWASQYHLFLKLLQWVIVIFQATFWVAVIWPLARWIYIPLGLSFHIGILLTLGADFYPWIALYVVFIPWTHFFRSFLQQFRPATEKIACA